MANYTPQVSAKLKSELSPRINIGNDMFNQLRNHASSPIRGIDGFESMAMPRTSFKKLGLNIIGSEIDQESQQ